MSGINKKNRLLIVDTSTAMLHVLKTYADRQNHDADFFSDPDEACVVLNQRFQNFDSDYCCVIVGWPSGKLDLMSDFLSALNSANHQGLPLIVVCQERSHEVLALVNTRPNTQALLWNDYQQMSVMIDRFAARPVVHHSVPAARIELNSSLDTVASGSERPLKTVLLLDNVPSVCNALREAMESSGYQVTVTSTVADARTMVAATRFDLIVIDYFLNEEGGEDFCRYLNYTMEQSVSPVSVVLTTKYSDSIVKRALAAGAAACLYKNESTDLLFTRINALLRARPQVGAKQDNNREKRLLLSMVEWIEQAAIVLDQNHNVMAANRIASELLAADDADSLCGTDFTNVCDSIRLNDESRPDTNAIFATADDTTLEVSYTTSALLEGDQSISLLTFQCREEVVEQMAVDDTPVTAVDPVISVGKSYAIDDALTQQPDLTIDTQLSAVELQQVEPAESVAEPSLIISVGQSAGVHALDQVETTDEQNAQAISADVLPANPGEPQNLTTRRFEKLLTQVLVERPAGHRHSLLMLDIQIIAATGDRLCLGDSEPLLKIVNDALVKLYPRKNSLAYLGRGQFAFILASRSLQDALSLTRKVQQLIPQMVRYLSNMTLVSHGAIMPLANESTLRAPELMKQCQSACRKTRLDERDNAVLVMSLNQYLTANSTKSVSRPEAEKTE